MSDICTDVQSYYCRLDFFYHPFNLDPSSAVEEEEDPENEQYNEELLQLLKMESEGNDLFQSYKSTFNDQYGDQHDWQSGTTMQHYLCRQLFIHYTCHVRRSCKMLYSSSEAYL